MPAKTHWKKLTNPDYLGAYALDEGAEPILTIRVVQKEMVTGADGKKEECIVCHWAEPNVKPMILNVTNCKTIAKLYKTPFIEEWAGKRIQLRVQPVRAFGDTVEALRVKPTIPPQNGTAKEKPVVCSDCGQVISAAGQYTASQVAQIAMQRFKKPMCADCMRKAKETAEQKEEAPTEATDLTNALKGEKEEK